MTDGFNMKTFNNCVFYKKSYYYRALDDDRDWEIISEEEFKLATL